MNRTITGRRRVVAAVAGLAVAASLAACTQGSSSTGGGVDVVTLNGDRSDFADAYADASTALKGLTGYELDARNVPSTENYQQIVRSSLQTSSTTDLVKWWNGYRLQELVRTGGLADLSAEWDKAVDEGWVNPDTKESFSYDGKVYGLPLYKSYWVMFYNRAVFDKVGITPPKTWAEFESNNAKLKAAGVTPLFATQQAGWTSFIWFEEILSKLDPEFYTDLMNGKASYTDGTVQQAMKIWVHMFTEGWFTAPDTAWDDEPSLFAAGSVAQVPMGTWRNGTFAGLLDEDAYGAFVLPPMEGADPSVIVESGVLTLAAKAPHAEGGRAVLSDWLNPDVQRPWITKLKDTSANPEVTTDDEVLSSALDQVQQQKPRELVRYWEAGPPALIEGGVQYLGAFMADPTEANIMPTLQKLQDLATTEWANWKAAE